MKKIIGFLLVFLFMVFFVFSEAEYKNLYRLGIAPMVQNGIKTSEQARELLKKEKFSIYLLLRNFNVPKSIFEQIGQVVIKEIELKLGSRFEAMSFKVSGRTKTTGRIQWMGREFIDAFSFSLIAGNKRYTFIIPKVCGNITLWKIEEIEEKEEKKRIPSFSEFKEAEKEFKKVFVPEITQPVLSKIPPKIKKEKSRTDFFLDLALGAFRGCHQEYLTERIGLKYRLFGKCFLMISPGIGFPIGKNSGEWKRTYHGDLALWCDLRIVSIELGAGYSSKVKELKKEQFEFIANLGLNLTKRVNLFVEGRIPLESFKDSQIIKDNHKIISGIRYFF